MTHPPKQAASVKTRATGTLGFLLLSVAMASAGEEFFSSKISPLLKQRCYECHSHEAGKMKGGLTLDAKSGWEAGGDTGPAIVPGKPQESLLMKMVRWTDDDHKMPPKQPLPPEEIALLEQWINQGAPDPRTAPVKADANWWSLQPIVKPAPPTASANPIDAFVHQTLEAKGLRPSPEADRRTLLRRLYFDLHGLPPTPAEVAAFLRNDAPQAYEQLVDQLLASPAMVSAGPVTGWTRFILRTPMVSSMMTCDQTRGDFATM